MMPPLTNEELRAIEVRVEAAQTGPWRAVGFAKGEYQGDGWPVVFTAGEGRDGKTWCVETDGVRASMTNGAGAEEDAAFVAAARQDVPRLAHEVRRLYARPFTMAALERHPLGVKVAVFLSAWQDWKDEEHPSKRALLEDEFYEAADGLAAEMAALEKAEQGQSSVQRSSE